MIRRFFLTTCAALTLSCSPRQSTDQRVLTVFAAASLSTAFTELGRTFEQQHPGYTVRLNLAGSQQLVLQLQHGATADVLASADERWMQAAADSGLLAEPATVFARNSLVVVLPRNNPGRIERLEDLTRPGIKLVLGSEAVPVGKYAREMLANLSGSPGYAASFGEQVLRNVVSFEDNVRAVATKVRLGEADAGIVYRSDVGAASADAVTVLPIPDPYNVIAAYPIAVLRNSPNPSAARAFVALILSAEGQDRLEHHGLMRRTTDTLPSSAAR